VTGVLDGFLVIFTIIGIGYGVGRGKILSAQAERDLSRLIVSVMTPCLLISILAGADLARLFSATFAVALITVVVCMGLYVALARTLWRRRAPDTVVGALASGFANAGNIGIPMAQYVLGDAALTAPLILLQLALITPVALLVLDVTARRERDSVGTTLRTTLLSPVLIAAGVGLLLAGFHVAVPAAVMEPFRLIGQASIPLILLTFGMSLKNERPLAPGSGRRDIVVASLFKLGLMPVLAWVLGRYVFDLSGLDLLSVTLLAGLPTAQNVFAVAGRYEHAVPVARDTVLVTTLGSIPTLLLIAAVLTP
jgi:malonate transporter and related proteins